MSRSFLTPFHSPPFRPKGWSEWEWKGERNGNCKVWTVILRAAPYHSVHSQLSPFTYRSVRETWVTEVNERLRSGSKVVISPVIPLHLGSSYPPHVAPCPFALSSFSLRDTSRGRHVKEMQRLDWSLSRKVTQDIKTQPQINHYQSISVLCSYRLLSVLCCGFLKSWVHSS